VTSLGREVSVRNLQVLISSIVRFVDGVFSGFPTVIIIFLNNPASVERDVNSGTRNEDEVIDPMLSSLTRPNKLKETLAIKDYFSTFYF
jgi:hypothetical protein